MRTKNTFLSTLVTSLWQFNHQEWRIQDGIRSAIGVALPLLGGILLQHALIGVSMAVGALVGGFSVLKGTQRRRLRMFSLSAFWLGVATFVGAYTGNHLAINVVVVMVSGFIAGIAVSAGLDTMQLGIFSTTALVVFSGFPASLVPSIEDGLAVLAGALLQGLLYILFEIIHPSIPEEARAIVRLIQSIAHYSLTPDGRNSLVVARNFLEAEEALNDSRLPAHDWSRYRALVDIIEAIRSDILAVLSDLPQEGPAVAAQLEYLAQYLLDGSEALRPAHAWPPHPRLPTLVERLQWAYHTATIPIVPNPFKNPPLHRHLVLPRMRANLTPSSMAFRHGLRLAVTLAVAVLLYHLIPLTRGYWVPLTVLVILRPDFQATVTRGLLRIFGTLVGIMLSTGLLAVAYPHASLGVGLLLVMIFAVALYSTINVNYGLFSIFVTAEVMVLLSFFEKAPPLATMSDRLLNTLIGGVLALLAYRLWPTWQHYQLRPQLRAWVHDLREYLIAITEAPYAVTPIRKKLRIDRTNLAVTMTESGSEPHPSFNLHTLEQFVMTLTHLTEILLTLEWEVKDTPAAVWDEMREASSGWSTRLSVLESHLESNGTRFEAEDGHPMTRHFRGLETDLIQLEELLPQLEHR